MKPPKTVPSRDLVLVELVKLYGRNVHPYPLMPDLDLKELTARLTPELDKIAESAPSPGDYLKNQGVDVRTRKS